MKAHKFLIPVLLLLSFSSIAQLGRESKARFRKSEDSLKVYGNDMIFADKAVDH
jgi:hypothetical protein